MSLVNETNTAVVTLTQFSLFIDEIYPNYGTADSKYVSQVTTLDKTSTGLRIMFSAELPPEATYEIYYRARMTSFSVATEDLNWVKLSIDTPINTTPGVFIDRTYDVQSIAEFNEFQVKLVMKSTSVSKVPRFKYLRIIALA